MDFGKLGPWSAWAAVAALWLAGANVLPAAEPQFEGRFVQAAQPQGGPAGAPAPPPVLPSPGQFGPEEPTVFAPPDRATLRLLSKAQQLVEQDRYAEAVRCLGTIFESPQDYFLQSDEDAPGPRSLKSEAQRLLGQMSRRGRDLYELQYGARARQMLSKAAAAGDPSALAEVSRRFFHTRAGYEATLLLGLHQLDHGSPLAAALTLERLRNARPATEPFEPGLSLATATCWIRAGMPDKARGVLSLLSERYPSAKVEIGGEPVRLFAGSVDPLDWLTGLLGPQRTTDVELAGQWTVFRGDAARNASTAGSGPLMSMRWRVPTADHPYVEALLEQIRDADRDWDRSALPALHPLVVDDVVLMRTARNLLAVDFATGKRIWEAPVDDPFEVLLNPADSVPRRSAPFLEQALWLRMWGDATYGTISSDRRRVFAIEDLGLEVGRAHSRAMFIPGRSPDDPVGPKPYNRLAAYDVRTGKLRWHLGGSPAHLGLPQAGTFFLGPPLPLMDRLYVIAETMGEICLMVLDAKTGDFLWSQRLAGADEPLLQAPLRRMAGASPSYADGVLVCPTSNRSIVAVELATRSLLWGYTYPPPASRSHPGFMLFGTRSAIDPNPVGRWTHSSVVLAEGRVLATPVDSDDVHCLNLIDGKLLWKEPREDDLYLACVHQGKAVLVARRRVRALDLHKTRRVRSETNADRSGRRTAAGRQPQPPDHERPAPAWDGRTIDLPPEGMPSGIGLLSGDLYYLPLSSGEVMAVDLSAGRPERVFKSRRGSIAGNLICYRGKVLSQDAAGLESFDQLGALQEEVDRRLAANGDDAEALALSGEICWEEGRLQEAIRCFRRSLELEADANTRDLLREALLDGLRTEFATQRHDAEEIQRLLEEPAQRATYLRLTAAGLEGAGEFRAALDHYMKLVELDVDHRDMEHVDKSLSVRRDRWIQIRLAALREEAPPELRAEIDQEVQSRLRAALDQGEAEPLERFLEYFGGHPTAHEARRELVRRLQQAGRLLSAELLLLRQGRSETAQLAAGATAELADLLSRAERWHNSAIYYRRLRDELADVVCPDGKTGRELAEALPADSPVRKQLDADSPWPTGAVVVEKGEPKKSPPSTYNQAPLVFEGARGPFFSDMIVELHLTPPQLVGRDGWGNRRWVLSLVELARDGEFMLNRGLTRLSACGHLLLLASGQRALAVDTLGSPQSPLPRLLWSQDVDEPAALPPGREQLRFRLANWAGGVPQIHLAGHAYDPIVTPKVISERLLCFKRLRRCLAVDPCNGEVLWERQGIPRDCDVFGDDQYVFVVPQGETTATVLRALDGTVAGQREVPGERAGTFGRRVLVWRHANGRRVLELVDPWANRPVWAPREFSANATFSVVEDEAAAVYEPDGRFVLVGLDDGRTIIDAKLEPQRSFPEILVLPSPDQYVVVSYNPSPNPGQSRGTYAVHGVASVRITQGRVYAFDREGNPMWPSPVKVEDQHLPLSQPGRLPVLAFACMVQERQPQTTRSKTSILCIDKRTGREILREDYPSQTNSFYLVGDPEKKTVELQLQRNTVTMTFTDGPLSPEPAEPAGGPRTTRAVWKAIRAAIIGEP